MNPNIGVYLLVLFNSQWTKGVVGYYAKRDPDLKEYCLTDRVNITCKANEVIIIKTARYGRMRADNKCTDKKVNINCSVDILNKLDTLCSGKRSCTFTLPGEGTGIYETNPCGKDYVSYMEASNRCVKVESATKDRCISRKKIRTTKHHGFISSYTTMSSNMGSYHCPWLIETYPGQQINVTIYSFIRNHTANSHSSYTYFDAERNSYDNSNVRVYANGGSTACYNKMDVGVIYEAGKKKTITMCKGSNNRIVDSYISITNTLEFRFVNKNILQNLGRFLVEYKVTGCPDIEVPSDTWTERKGDMLMVKCNKSRSAWHLTCNGDTWVGKVGNCTLGNGVEIINSVNYSVNMENTDNFPYGILFVVAIGVAIGIVLGGGMLCFLVACNKRREKNHGPFAVSQGSNSMYVNPQTRAWVQAHHHQKQSSEHEQQYIDEGIVRDIQTFHAKDPALYGDVMGNEPGRVHNVPIPNQINVPAGIQQYGPQQMEARSNIGSTRQDTPLPGHDNRKIPHDHIGMMSHVYERPQST